MVEIGIALLVPTNPDDFVSGWASFEIQLCCGYGQAKAAAAGDFCLLREAIAAGKERRVLGRYTLVRCVTVTRQQQ